MIYLAGTDFSHLTDDEILNGIKALNIPDYIRTKSYGVDVRETLAQMTEMLMQLAYNQGMSPQQAQEFVYEINNKIDKGEVTMSDLSQEIKEAFTGGAVAVVGVDAVGTENVKDGAIALEKLSENLRAEVEGEIHAIQNLVRNGNFANTENWETSTGVAISGGVATLTANGSTQFLTQNELWEANLNTGHDIFISFEILENTLVGNGAFGFNGLGVDDFSSGENINGSVGTHTLVQKVRSGTGKDNRISFWLSGGYTSGRVKIANVVVVDLTKTFGNNQPNSSYIENLLKENGGYFANLSSSDILKNEFVKSSHNLGTSVIIKPQLTLGRVTLTDGTIWDMDGNKAYFGTTNKIKIPYGTKRIRHNFMPYFPSDGTAGYAMYDASGAFLYGGKSTNIELNGQERYFSVTGYDLTKRHDALYKIQFIFDEEVKSLKNKKINFIGDSITWGTNPDSADVNTTTSDTTRLKPFSETVYELTGALTTNYGWGGRTLAVDREDGSLGVINLIDLPESIDFDADIVFILIGINDLHTTRELGAFGDTTASTFYGALDILCKKISTNWRVSEGKQVAISTYFDYDREPNWSAWMDAIRTVCKQYAIPVADLMYEARINPKTDDGELFAYRADGLKDPHPKQAGYDAMGRYYANWLKSHFEI